jgi:intein/homing endonuclease
MLPQNPGYQATASTSRILVRGNLEFFNWKFFYDTAETQPIIPLDPQAYPSYRILDPSGTILAQGVAVPAGTPGTWKVGWVVPRTAQLTNVNRRYQMSTVMVDKEMRQWELSWEFDVVESAVTAQDPELQQFLSFIKTPVRLFFKNTVRPSELSVKFFPKGQDGTPSFAAYFTYPVPSPITATDIVEFEDGTGFTYYADTPPVSLAGSYSALWQVRDTPISQVDYEHQVVQVVTSSAMHMVNSLRMLVDKLQKKLGLSFAYANEDLYEYILEGTKLVNSYWPPSNYSASSPPNSIEAFIVLGAAWWGLNAQRILYAETNLSFCVDLETLLPTKQGMIRAKDLVFDRSILMRKNISKQLIYGNEEKLFDTLCQGFGDGTRSIEIIEALGLDSNAFGSCSVNNRDPRDPATPVALGGLFSRFTLNSYRYFDSLGKPVWDVPKFRQHLEDNYGMFYQPEEGGYELDFPDLLTPYGYEKPVLAWYLKQKEVYRVENELGYEVIATGNHPILTLDTTTFEMKWKTIDNLVVGDLIAQHVTEASEDEDWEVSFEENLAAVYSVSTGKTQSPYSLPNKMTSELARLCGYLIAEGCHSQYDRITFSNTDLEIIKDFNRCCVAAFGKEAEFLRSHDNSQGTYGGENSKIIHIYALTGVEIRRFFFSLGFGYEKSPELRIPDIIFRSPKNIACDFIRGYFEGDGCYSEGIAIFCSSSHHLLSDLQQLLLRFGIVSKKFNPKKSLDGCGRVTICGPSLVSYADKVGFLTKGNEFKPKSRYYPQREALNPEVLHALMDLPNRLGIKRGWKDGKRYSVYWAHNAKGPHKNGHCLHVTWEHIERWFKDRGDDLQQLDVTIWQHINLLLESKFLWKKVTEIETLGRRDVVDPSFLEQGRPLDHAFITNGLVTHNSGQTVTLEYNPGADIDGIMSSFKEILDNQVSKVKQQLLRQSSAVGSIATRPYRYRTNVVFPVSSGPGQTYFQHLQELGLIDWLG